MLLFNPIELASVCGCPTARLCEVKRRDCRRPFDSVVQRVIQQDIHTHRHTYTVGTDDQKAKRWSQLLFLFFSRALIIRKPYTLASQRWGGTI